MSSVFSKPSRHLPHTLALMLLAASATPALAQDVVQRAAAADNAPKPGQVLTLKCCHCLGETATLDLSTGAAPWRVKPPSATAFVPVVPTVAPHALWVNPAPNSAKWVDDVGNGGTAAKAGGLWVYELRVRVPKCVIPFVNPIKLTGWVTGDDDMKTFVGPGPSPTTMVASAGPGWAFQNKHPFSATLVPGLNTIRVEITNGGPSPSGMAFFAKLAAPCIKEQADSTDPTTHLHDMPPR